MFFKKGEKYKYHVPNRVPFHYVCAMCHKGLVYRDLNNVLEWVGCSNNPNHLGFLDHTKVAHDSASIRQVRLTADLQEVSEIAKTSPEVKQLLVNKREKDNKELFGDE